MLLERTHPASSTRPCALLSRRAEERRGIPESRVSTSTSRSMDLEWGVVGRTAEMVYVRGKRRSQRLSGVGLGGDFGVGTTIVSGVSSVSITSTERHAKRLPSDSGGVLFTRCGPQNPF